MNEKLLFHGVPATTEADITAGPAMGKTWVITALWIVNTAPTDKTLTLKHYIDASNTRTLIPGTPFPAQQTEIIGPLVLEAGHKLRASQGTADAIELIAYGLEGTA